jgi:hypothetical protein
MRWTKGLWVAVIAAVLLPAAPALGQSGALVNRPPPVTVGP